MSPADVIVAILGVALVAGELWFFLRSRGSAARRTADKDGVQEVRIVVRDGYDPATIVVEPGRPVRLLLYRDETAQPSAQIVFPGLGIKQELPAFETTALVFTPDNPGDYPFHDADGLRRGRIVAQVGREAARANLGRGHAKHG